MAALAAARGQGERAGSDRLDGWFKRVLRVMLQLDI
jgi:hypothetical protein